MAGQPWLRFTLICAAPLVTLLLVADSPLVVVSFASSLAAAGFDVLRQRRRCLPFPIYLLLVYALQIYCILVMPQDLIGVVGVGHGQHWFDGTKRTSSVAALENLPAVHEPPVRTMSVVIAAHNEHKYMKRTLDSIYEKTPPDVLKEIIVVDDASNPPLAESLKDHPQVRLIRHEQRKGLIKSKTEGGNLATSDMIMFLDGHVKPDENWWQPLLRHMNKNYRRVVVPVIPILDGNTWEPNNNAVGIKMMFDWTLFFQWFEDFNDLVPCMSGGLFGITRRWWHESGEYDYGMSMWGAENIEQSIRIWLCGGEVYVARDSRVSHVFRSTFPYEINNTEIYINKVRTVEVWFDEYKERFYEADPAARQFVKFVGDVSERVALRKALKCKPFSWYVDKFKDVFVSKHMLEEETFLIRDKTTGRCLQVAADHQGVQEAECNTASKMQQWTKANHGEGFRNSGTNQCLDANAGVSEKDGSSVFLFWCETKNEQQAWTLDRGQLHWKDKCIQGAPEGKLKLARCSASLRSRGFEMYNRHTVKGPGVL